MSDAEHTALSSLGPVRGDSEIRHGWSMDVRTDNKLKTRVLCFDLDEEAQTISNDMVVQGTSQ